MTTAPTALARQFLDELYEKIRHGDEQHQAWLRERLLGETDALAALIEGHAAQERSPTLRELFERDRREGDEPRILRRYAVCTPSELCRSGLCNAVVTVEEDRDGRAIVRMRSAAGHLLVSPSMDVMLCATRVEESGRIDLRHRVVEAPLTGSPVFVDWPLGPDHVVEAILRQNEPKAVLLFGQPASDQGSDLTFVDVRIVVKGIASGPPVNGFANEKGRVP